MGHRKCLVKKSKTLELGVSCQSVSAYCASMRTQVQIPSAQVKIWHSGNPSRMPGGRQDAWSLLVSQSS